MTLDALTDRLLVHWPDPDGQALLAGLDEQTCVDVAALLIDRVTVSMADRDTVEDLLAPPNAEQRMAWVAASALSAAALRRASVLRDLRLGQRR